MVFECLVTPQRVLYVLPKALSIVAATACQLSVMGPATLEVSIGASCAAGGSGFLCLCSRLLCVVTLISVPLHPISLTLTQPNIYVHIWLHGCIYIYTFVFIEVISLKSLNTCLFINLSEHSHSKYA